MSISPVLVLTNTNPIGVAENTPALAPETKLGNTLASVSQTAFG